MSTASGYIAARLQQALLHARSGDLTAAEAVYEEILKTHPRHAETLMRLAVIAGQKQNPQKALLLLDKAIEVDPRNPVAFNNKGMALQLLKRWEAAIASYDRALSLHAGYAIAHYNRANTLGEMGRREDALSGFDRALRHKPDFAEAHFGRAATLGQLGKLEAALSSYAEAIKFQPNYAEAFFNRGTIQRDLMRWHDAVASFDQAIALRGDYAEAYLNRGDVLHTLKRRDAALESYDKAIAIRRGYGKAYFNRGNIFRELKKFDRALDDYAQAHSAAPDLEFLLATRRYTRMQVCDWGDFDADVSRLATMIERGEPTSPPFGILGLLDSAALQLRNAQAWVRQKCPINDTLPPIMARATDDRIRIGYFSADFHDHATSYLIAGLLESHDRSRFEIVLFSFGPGSLGPMRNRLIAAASEFVDVRQNSDMEIATMARDRHIDIAIDLKGFTQDSRPGIFALRAAPVQVNYLGFPGTMGAGYMDYIVADHTLIPPASRPHYAEKVIYLPDSYQPNDRTRAIAKTVFTRAELGLPQDGFVFCCFNNHFKLLPRTFDLWTRLLLRVPGSVFWLFADNAIAQVHLRREAAGRGVDPNRLIFAAHMDLPQHLARHRAADLFVDTWPCNAHTTASDALWAGLPIVTCPGETFASRVTASLLRAIRMPDLIAASPEEYEEIAVGLAMDRDRLTALREELARHRLTAPLFDTALLTRRIEAGYTRIHERSAAGLPPRDIDLDPVSST